VSAKKEGTYYERNKEQMKANSKRWRESNPVATKAINKRSKDKNRVEINKSKSTYNKEYFKRPDVALRRRANNAVSNALKLGHIQKQTCAVCLSISSEAHHHDYEQPLNVTWLCREDHRMVHEATPEQITQAWVEVLEMKE
jgi:hypothetical protein